MLWPKDSFPKIDCKVQLGWPIWLVGEDWWAWYGREHYHQYCHCSNWKVYRSDSYSASWCSNNPVWTIQLFLCLPVCWGVISQYGKRIKESDVYTCGSILFPPGSKYEKSIIVREALTCRTIETQYYSAKLVSFPPIYYHCGTREECIVNEEIQELKKYAVVYPFVSYAKVAGKIYL